MKNGDGLVIQAGQHRRIIVLPRVLVGLPVSVAHLESTSLKLKFQDKPTESKKASGSRK